MRTQSDIVSVHTGELSIGPPPMISGRLPVLGHAVEFVRRPTDLLLRGYAERGNMYCFMLGNRPAVVLLGPENNQFVFSETDKRLSLKEAYPFIRRMFSPDFYFFAEDGEYARQRAIILPRFQGKQLDGYMETMRLETMALEHQMGQTGEFNLTSVFGPVIMRIAAHTLFGKDFGDQLGHDEFRLFRRFAAGIRVLCPGWLPLPRIVLGRYARRTLYQLVLGFLRERRKTPLDPPDFFQTFAEATYADGTAVPDHVLANMLLFLTWSGHETTTGHLCWALIDLLQHPTQLDCVRMELQEVLGTAIPVMLEQVNRLKQMENALHETERLRPVVFAILRVATENIEHDGYLIPKGAFVLVSPWVSHRQPSVFPRPEEYWPQRFEQYPHAKAHLIGFGGGVHRCLGQRFAYLEMKLILSILLRDYDFELVDRTPETIQGAQTKWPASPCRVRYSRRSVMKRGAL